MSSAVDTLPVILDGTFFTVTERTVDKISAKCNTCTKLTIINGTVKATTNFLLHLRRKHPESVKLYENRKINEGPIVKKRRLEAASLSKKQNTLPNFSFTCQRVPSKKRSKIERLTMNFVVKGMHPLSTVDQPGFRELLKGIDPTIEPMTRRTLSRALVEQREELVSQIKQRIKDHDADFFCITADAWTCKGKSRGFMGVTLHWIDKTLKRGSAALACRRFKGTHSFDRIAELISQILAEYDIPIAKVIKGITDNGSNFSKAFQKYQNVSQPEDDEEESESDLELESNSSNEEDISIQELAGTLSTGPREESEIILPPHSRCASHTLSLVAVKDIETIKSKYHQSSLAKCFAIWNKIGRSTKSNEAVKEICGVQLIRPCATRWNSLYDSVSALLRQKSNINRVCAALEISTLSENETKYLEEYKICLAPIANALDKLQGDCHFGILIPTLMAVRSKLEILKNDGNLQQCGNLVAALLEGLNRRFKELLNFGAEQMDAVFASISHPYFKLRWIPQDKIESTRDLFISAVLELNSQAEALSPDLTLADEDERRKNDDFFSFPVLERSVTETQSNINKIRLQCHQYFEDQNMEIDMLFLYPSVKKAFIKFNTPLPSSAPVERLFNFGGMILSPNRRSLSDDTFETLLLLKANDQF